MRNFLSASLSGGSSSSPAGTSLILSRYATACTYSPGVRLPGSFFGIFSFTRSNSSDSGRPVQVALNPGVVYVPRGWHETQMAM
jgi:hypothetical protein